MSVRRSVVALAAAATVLTACGASAPPAKELANETVDTMLSRGDVTGPQADCMHAEIDAYVLVGDAAEGFDSLDDMLGTASEAKSRIEEGKQLSGDHELALEALEHFESTLATCR